MQRKIILVLLLFGLFTIGLAAKGPDVAKPFGTIFVREHLAEADSFEGIYYYYDTELSQESIVEFYRERLKSQGYEELYQDYKRDSKKAFFFEDKKKNKYGLIFFPKVEGGLLRYALEKGRRKEFDIEEAMRKAPPEVRAAMQEAIDKSKKQVVDTRNAHFFSGLKDPQPVGFMPLLPGLKQHEHTEQENSSLISLGYLTHLDANEAVKFYLDKMPQRGWVLFDKEDHAGSYQMEEWFPFMAPGSTFQPGCVTSILIDIPPLKIHGATMVFKAAGKKCIITVHTFDDAVELSKNHVYDLTSMEQYGSTVIGVVYFK